MKQAATNMLVLLTIILSSISVNGQKEIYVSPAGNDKNPGTLNEPLHSLQAALNTIKHLNNTVTVFMRGGNYQLSETLIIDPSIANGKKIVIAAYSNENVLISGGIQLDVKKFRATSDERMKRSPKAKGAIYETDLTDQGINEFGTMKQHGFGRIENAALEVFLDKQPLTVARWPNSGFVPIGKVLEPGSNTRAGDKRNIGARFQYDFKQPSGWKSADNIWLYGVFANGYADDNIQVESINTNDMSIKLKQAGYYGVSATVDQKNPSKIYPYRGYYFYNVAEELDSAGEYYLDRGKKKLYIYPTTDITSSAIMVSMLETPLLYLHHVSNISFKNIEFGYGRGIGIYAAGTENVSFENCEFYNFGIQAINVGEPITGINLLYNKKPISRYKSDNRNFSLTSCKIFNTGAGALTIAGGDRKTLTPAGNKISHSEIYNYSRTNRSSPAAIQLSGVGNTISHCYIHDGPAAAIGYKGNDHVISYNHIRNVASEFSDIGAVYTGRDPSSTGTRIQNNFFDSIQGRNNSAVASVYIDDCSSGIYVSDNVFFKCGTGKTGFGAIHVNGGYENNFENNYFINCDKAITNTVWKDENWIAYMQKPDMQKKLTQDVDVRSDVYISRYPFLKTLFEPSAIAHRKNYVTNSFIYRVNQFLPKTNRFAVSKTYTSENGSELADIKRKNFSLKPSMQKTTGLKLNSFDEIGLRKKNEGSR